ncbi:MAG: NAD(P)/FAD-dependent oxidoreductase [Gemmataceae bacterium]
MERFDVVVVGAGPAGAIGAWLLARSGRRVLLVDKASFPRYKVCGCCINPQAIAELRQLGLESARFASAPIDSLSLSAGSKSATFSINGWRVASRETLDMALVHEARRAGAEFLSQTIARFSSVRDHGCEIVLSTGGHNRRLIADIVVAADGLGGHLMADATGHVNHQRPNSRVGAGVVLSNSCDDFAPGVIHMISGTGGYVGLVRLPDQRLNVAAAFNAPFLRRCGSPGAAAAQILAQSGFPVPAGLVDNHWHGTVSLTRWPTRPAAERILAVGDAAGYVEPFTGEGIAWGITAAQKLAGVAQLGWYPGLADSWSSWYRRTSPQRRRLIRAVASATRHPFVAQTAIRAAKMWPGFASRIVNQWFNGIPDKPLRSSSQARMPLQHTPPAPACALAAPE